MAINSLKANVKLKKWYVVILKIAALTNNHKIVHWTVHTFWKRGSKIKIGGGD